MINSKEAGYSLIELIIVIALVGIIAATALPAYRIYSTRAFNTVAESDLRNLVKLVIPAGEQQGLIENYLFFNQRGSLPRPLSELQLSDGVVAPFIYRLSFLPFDLDFTIVSVYHERGNLQFYHYDLNGTEFRFQSERS